MPARTEEQIERINRSTLEFIQRYTETNGYPPSRREIAEHLGQSLSVAQGNVQRMIDEGLLEVNPAIARSIRVKGAAMKVVEETA
jgi:Mn-dependent DtxR family transcriptional regulator